MSSPVLCARASSSARSVQSKLDPGKTIYLLNVYFGELPDAEWPGVGDWMAFAVNKTLPDTPRLGRVVVTADFDELVDKTKALEAELVEAQKVCDAACTGITDRAKQMSGAYYCVLQQQLTEKMLRARPRLDQMRTRWFTLFKAVKGTTASGTFKQRLLDTSAALRELETLITNSTTTSERGVLEYLAMGTL